MADASYWNKYDDTQLSEIRGNLEQPIAEKQRKLKFLGGSDEAMESRHLQYRDEIDEVMASRQSK